MGKDLAWRTTLDWSSAADGVLEIRIGRIGREVRVVRQTPGVALAREGAAEYRIGFAAPHKSAHRHGQL
jgi:hypothetical protein